MTLTTETYESPMFKPKQRVIVTANPMRNHSRIDHLMGTKVLITGRSWERGAYWYTIRTEAGEKIAGLRFGDFRALKEHSNGS